MISSALSSAFTAREKMAHAQQQAMGALNLPSASDIEKLARRVRSVSQRLEELEDGIERGSGRTAALTSASRSAEDLSARLDRIEQRLDRIGKQVAAGQRTVDDTVRAADVVGPTRQRVAGEPARAQPAALPASVRRAVERTVQSTIGSAGSTRGRAQDLVDDVVRRAEHGAARAARGVREGASRQAEAAAGVPDRVRGAIGDLRFATREDLNQL